MDFWIPPKPAIIIPGRHIERPVSFRPAWVPGIVVPIIPASGVIPPSNTFTDSVVNTADQTATETFNTRPIGIADATRRVVVGAAWLSSSSTRTISTATIGGISATVHINSSNSGNGCGFISAAVPTGTTALIVLNFAGTATNITSCGIAVWSLLNATGSPSATASSLNPDVASVAINVPANGSIFSIAGMLGNGAPRTFTWTNGTERFDTTQEGNYTYTAASDTGMGVETPRTITVTSSGTTVVAALASMTWN